MNLSVSQNGSGITWTQLQNLASEVDRLGFAGIYCDDHFPGPNDAIVKLTYLASHTRDIRLGTLVSPLSMRDPVMLARHAMAINDLSDGRMTLGIGAGWEEHEHTTFGYLLGDVDTRMARLREGVEVITKLIRSPEPVTFDGRFFQLRNAQISPRPLRITPVMIGGNGPKRTLPLVAHYADVWNCQNAPLEVYKKHSARLDELLDLAGRRPSDVRRTLFVFVVCGRDDAEVERYLLEVKRAIPGMFGSMPTDQILEILRVRFNAIIGPPENLVEQLKAFAAAGVEEAMIAYFTPNSTECLEIIAKHVLPHIAAE